MKAERNFTTTDIFAEHLTLTFSLDNDTAMPPSGVLRTLLVSGQDSGFGRP